MTLRLVEALLGLVSALGGLAMLRTPRPTAMPLGRLGLSIPIALVRLNAAVVVVAGLALALDKGPALALSVLAVVLVLTMLVGHAFRTTDVTAHYVESIRTRRPHCSPPATAAEDACGEVDLEHSPEVGFGARTVDPASQIESPPYQNESSADRSLRRSR